MAKRMYKGFEIVKQTVGNMGWNIVNAEGRCVKTGCSTLVAAKEWIAMQVEIADLAE